MAGASRLGISSKTILSLSLLLLLLPSFPLANDARKSDEAAVRTPCIGNWLSICKLTGHFRVQFLGVVIECPEVEMPTLEPISGNTVPRIPAHTDPAAFAGGIHHPPVSSALVRDVPKEKLEACDGGDGNNGSTGAKEEAASRSDEL
ncbi:hypothetical protein ACP70R_029832 [Stipagrostis hirtigluma subsp. patula]